MSPAAGVPSQSDRAPIMQETSQPTMIPENFAKDAIIAWFRGEFVAANAIIDALCSHLTQLEGDGGGKVEYEAVFAAIHRRRLNWIPILQMQKYYSIADVAVELRKVADKKVMMMEREDQGGLHLKKSEEVNVLVNEKEKSLDISEMGGHEDGGGEVVHDEDESPESEITDTGSQEVQPILENIEICSNHDDCETRRDRMKMTKGFTAKEPVKGHIVNVVKGLKVYEEIFTDIELSKLTYYVNELRIAGQNGKLSGETFILYNQHMKGSKRELIQFGAPIFGQIIEEKTSHMEPIPALLQGVIDHLVQWHLISENKKPNGCIINFFDEGEYSQPFLKPPHLDQPVSTLLLSDSTMAFGRVLVSDNHGNYKGPLMLPLKEGSLLVMRGSSADTARHVMCASRNKRVSITFFKVRTDSVNNSSALPPVTGAMTLWQPSIPAPITLPNGYEATELIPKWGVIRTPLVMLAPVQPMVLSPRTISRDGTGVFLPWTLGSRKPAKHLPPRAQKGRLLALPSSIETHKPKTSDSSISAEGTTV